MLNVEKKKNSKVSAKMSPLFILGNIMYKYFLILFFHLKQTNFKKYKQRNLIINNKLSCVDLFLYGFK